MIRLPRISPETAVWSVVASLAGLLLISEALIRARALEHMIEVAAGNDPARTALADIAGQQEERQ